MINHKVYRYRLDGPRPDSWCTVVSAFESTVDSETVELRGRYGDRLLEVKEHIPKPRRKTNA